MEKVLIFTKNLELLLGIVMCKVGRWGPLGNIRKRTEILTQQSKTLEKIGHDYIYKPIFCMQKLFSNVAAGVMQKWFKFQVQFILVLFLRNWDNY